MAANVGAIQAILELKNRMSGQLKGAAKDMDRFQSKMDKLGQSATRLGGAMTAGITVPLVAIAATSVKTFAEFEKTMSAVEAVTGAVGEDFEKLESLALKMGETTVFTASQAAEAMKSFGLAGFTTNEILSALQPTLNLAAAGSMDMGTAASIAAKVTRGFGIAAADTTQAMDVLTKAFTTSNTNLVELGNAFKMVGPVAKTAGLSFEMTTAALQILADAGMAGSMGGRILRRALLQLVNPAGDAAKTLKRLGVETVTAGGRLLPFDNILKQIEPHLQDTAAMAEIFGTIAMPGMVEILGKGSDELNRMTRALEDSEGTGSRIAGVMLDNLTGAFTIFTSAVEGVQVAIGEELEPVLTFLLGAFTTVMRFVSNTVIPGFGKLEPTIKLMIGGFLAAAAAAGPLILAFGLFAPSIGPVLSTIAALAQGLTVATFGWAALAAVVVVWLAKNEKARAFFAALGKVILGLANVIGKGLVVALNFAVTAVNFLLDRLAEFYELMLGKGFALLTKWLGIAGDAMMNFGKKTDDVVDKAEELRQAVKKLLSGDASMQSLKNAWWQLTRTGHGTEEMFQDIAAQALALHQVTGEEMPVGLKKLVDRFDLLGDAVGDANEPVEESLENWEKLAKKWREGAIPQAKDMVKALDKIGGTSKLTRKEMDAVNSTLDRAIQKYGRLGKVVPTGIMRGWLETLKEMDTVSIDIDLTVPPMPAAMEAAGWGYIGDWLVQPIADASAGIQAAIAKALRPPPGMIFNFGKTLGQWLTKGFKAIVKNLPDTIIDAFKGGGGIFGALQAIGAQAGSVIGGSLGESFGASIKEGGGAGKIMLGIADMAGPIGAAIGALAGPLIGFIGDLFSGPSVQESVTKTAKRWGVAMSEGLANAIAETRKRVSSDIAAMMLHIASIIEEAGGVMAFGLDKSIAKVRDLFVMIETGRLTAKEVTAEFSAGFRMIADAVVDSKELASDAFLELISLAGRFGVVSGEVLAFIGEQTNVAASGLADMAAAGISSKEELEDLGLIAVAAFDAALASGLSFTEAVKMTKPALDALIAAEEELGSTSDNVALKALLNFQTRVSENETLVRATEALDDTMLALSRTGALNGETLAAMGRQGVRSFEKLIKAGFTEREALLMMGDALQLIKDAHEKLGIPIDENTQKLLDQATASGVLEDKQEVGWKAVATSIDKVVAKLQEMIDKIFGVSSAISTIPSEITTTHHVNTVRTDKHGPTPEYLQNWDGPTFQGGGVIDAGSGTLAMLHGKEAVIPLDTAGSGSDLLSEVKGLRQDLRLLPIHLRDAIIISQ